MGNQQGEMVYWKWTKKKRQGKMKNWNMEHGQLSFRKGQ